MWLRICKGMISLGCWRILRRSISNAEEIRIRTALRGLMSCLPNKPQPMVHFLQLASNSQTAKALRPGALLTCTLGKNRHVTHFHSTKTTIRRLLTTPCFQFCRTLIVATQLSSPETRTEQPERTSILRMARSNLGSWPLYSCSVCFTNLGDVIPGLYNISSNFLDT